MYYPVTSVSISRQDQLIPYSLEEFRMVSICSNNTYKTADENNEFLMVMRHTNIISYLCYWAQPDWEKYARLLPVSVRRQVADHEL